MTNVSTLSFTDLDTDKMIEYMELTNKIVLLGRRLRRSFPIRIGMAVVTLGSSLLLSGPRAVYQVIKKALSQDAAKALVENERARRNCTYIDWDTFPSAHIVIGGKPIQGHGQAAQCPLCKNFELRGFVASGNHEVFCCNNPSCGQTMVVRVNRYTLQTEELLIPGVLIAPIPFTHPIEHLHNLADHVCEFADSIGDTLAILMDTALDIIS